MTAKVLLYTLILVIVISITLMNVFSSVVDDRSALNIVIPSLISALFTLGLISLLLKAAIRWRRVSGVLFLLMGLGALIILSFYYDDRGISYTDYPFLLFPHLAMALSWVVSGVLVWRGAESED